MLINLRNALMTGKRLPYDAEVEYLYNAVASSTNHTTIDFPYIDTGIAAADDVGVQITYEYRTLAASKGAMVCGSFVSSGSGYYGVYNYGTYNYKLWGGATQMPTQIQVGDVLTTRVNYLNSMSYEDVRNGLQINSGTLSGSPTFNPGSIWAFAINKGNYTTYEIAGLRIYGLKITKGSTLVRDFIPVRKSGVGYLYDRVSGRLFGNAGTGAFGYGGDLNAHLYDDASLVFAYDGIENDGYGAHKDSGKWVDFVSNTSSTGTMTFDANSVTIAGGSLHNVYYGSPMPQALVTALASGTSTVEWCAKVAELDAGNTSRNQVFYNYSNPSMSVAMAYVAIGGKTIQTPLDYSNGYALISRAATQNGGDGGVRDNITGMEWSATGCTQVTPSIFRSQLYFKAGTTSHLYAYRVYNRILTAAETARHAMIDWRRFGLGG